MADIFRSAFNYISEGIGNASGETERGGDMIGEVVDLGQLKLKVRKVLAEGGYGFVYVATDNVTGKEFAIKRQIVPSDQVKLIKQEVSFLKQLKGHPHIIEFIGAAGTAPKQGGAEFIIVTELISGSNMVDIVNNQRLSPCQVLRVFHEVCLAVAHMHRQKPPIIHRDLKVENLLLTSGKRIKLCDFGSATTHQVIPDHTMSATQRGLAEDEIQRNTTPMYRSPEMIDLYSNNPVNEKADIWALGCLLFKLCYQEHPFEDSAKLRILNANYHIPSNDIAYSLFHGLIRSCLMVEPQKRPTADDILAQLFPIADNLGENLDGPHKEPLNAVAPAMTQPQTSEHQNQHESGGGGSMGVALQNTQQQAHKIFGMMRGGAENLFKNIKDTSNKVISSVQGGSRSRPLDITYITSRILVMSFPYEVPSQPYQNTIDEVGAYLEEAHPSQYLVFNLSGEQYDVAKFNGQVVDYEWPFKVVPPLESLVELCRQMDSWLKAETQNVLVIHCKDGVQPSLTLTVLYLLFLKALPTPQTAVRLFLARRLPEGQGIQTTASERRYMKYMVDLVGPKPFKPHSRSLYILNLKLSSVPLYNEAKTGCKPFLEIFIDGERVFTSCTKDNMDSIREYTAKDGTVQIPVGTSVCGNLHIIVHHIKSVPKTKGAGVGMSAVKMFHLQFHTGFVPLDATSMTFNRNELDGPAAKRIERFPDPFKASFDLQVESTEQLGASIAWQQLPHPQTYPITCFSTVQEQDEILEMFCKSKNRSHSSQAKATPIKPDEGYSHLKNDENVAVADLLGDNTTATPYTPYRDQEGGDESDSSSSSSSSSGSSSSDERGKDQYESFTNYKTTNDKSRPPPTSSSSAHPSGGGVPEQLEDFFSNPNAGIEEANLLEFGTEDNEEELLPPPSNSQQTFDPFSMWETTPSNGQPTSNPSSISTSSAQNQGDFFSMWDTPSSSTTAPPMSTTTTTTGPLLTPSVTPPSLSADPPTSSSTSFDPFGAWDEANRSPKQPQKPVSQKDPKASDPLEFDPFKQQSMSSSSGDLLDFTSSSTTTPSSNTFLQPPGTNSGGGFAAGRSNSWTTFGQVPSSASTQNAKPHDPFGDIWNTASGSNGSARMNSQPQTQQHTRGPSPSHQPVMTNRPMYQMNPGGQNYGPRSSSAGPHKPPAAGSSSKVPGNNNSRPPSSNSSRPRSVSPNDPKANKFGPVPGSRRNQFDDLLDQNLFTNKKEQEEGPKPLKTLKAKNKIDQITDPDRARVAEWAEGKEHNIRALISSLHTILWEGEKRWKPIGMHQLVEGEQVSKFFRKACLSVHPDKAQGSAHENLARAIFDELNDAYELFESSGAKSLYQ